LDKETFDKRTAAIWTLYNAAKTLNDAGLGLRARNEAVQKELCLHTATLANALADSLDAKPTFDLEAAKQAA
jgi:hypothetical protein